MRKDKRVHIMRICFFFAGMYLGGIQRTISLLSELYVKNGDSVTVVTLDDRDSFYPLSPEVRHYRLGLLGNSRNKVQAVLNVCRRISGLRKILKEERPDVLTSFGPSAEFVCFFAKIGMGCKLVGAEQSNPYLSGYGFWNRSKRLLARLCDGFIFQTNGAAGYYPASVRAKGIIFQNGLKADDFKRAERPWDERKDICAVGRMVEEKCFDDLLYAFSTVHEKYPDIKLDIYGDGPLRSRLEELAARLRLDGSVNFRGQCTTILEEYASHRIFVMSSKHEGLPNVLMEALASGCACVAANCDFGPSELICDGENGFLVPVHDPDAMADRLCLLLEDKMLCRRLSETAVSIRDTHDIARLGASLRSYLARLCRKQQEESRALKEIVTGR